MKPFDAFEGIGPADALMGAARRLRLEFDPQDLLERFDAHAEPNTLLALVEVARQSGLAAHAYRGGPDDLSKVPLPAVVHLIEPEGHEEAFALLLEQGGDGFVLENPARRQQRRLSRDEFLELWTGVVAIVSADPSAGRAGAGRAPRPAGAGFLHDVVSGGAMGSARLAALVLLGGLATIGAVRLGMSRTSPGAIVAALGGVCLILLGASVSAVLFVSSRRSRVSSAVPRLASALCGRGKLADCEGVLSSRFSTVAGIELTSWGLAFFVSTLVMAALGAVLETDAAAHLGSWLAVAFLIALPASLFLIGVQFWPLGRICPLCMTVHGSIIAAALLGLPLIAGFESLSQAAVVLLPWAILHAVAFVGALGFLAPLIDLGIENRTHRARLAWIANTPWGALAETAGRPHADHSLLPVVRLGDAEAPFRIDALVHVTCSGCPPVLEKLERLVHRRAGHVQLGLHFPTRDPGNPGDREFCVALTALGAIAGGEQLLRVFSLVKKDALKRIDAARDGAERMLSEFLPPEAPVGPSLTEARRAVTAADRVLDTLRRGTPTVLLNGRPWDSPLEDLEMLLATRPELLADVLGIELAPTGAGAGEKSAPAPRSLEGPFP